MNAPQRPRIRLGPKATELALDAEGVAKADLLDAAIDKLKTEISHDDVGKQLSMMNDQLASIRVMIAALSVVEDEDINLAIEALHERATVHQKAVAKVVDIDEPRLSNLMERIHQHLDLTQNPRTEEEIEREEVDRDRDQER